MPSPHASRASSGSAGVCLDVKLTGPNEPATNAKSLGGSRMQSERGWLIVRKSRAGGVLVSPRAEWPTPAGKGDCLLLQHAVVVHALVAPLDQRQQPAPRPTAARQPTYELAINADREPGPRPLDPRASAPCHDQPSAPACECCACGPRQAAQGARHRTGRIARWRGDRERWSKLSLSRPCCALCAPLPKRLRRAGPLIGAASVCGISTA